MHRGNNMFSFSAKIWYNKQRVSQKDNTASVYLEVIIDRKHKPFDLKMRWPVDKIDTIKNKLLSRHSGDSEVKDSNLIIECELAKYTEIRLTYRLRKENLTMEKFIREVKTFDSKECFITYFRDENERRYRKKEIEQKTYQNAKAVLAQVMAFDKLSLFKNIDKAWLENFQSYLSHATHGKDNKRYALGTIWDRLKTTMGYLTLASNEPMIYVNKDVFTFKHPKPPEKTTYLSRAELTKLIDLQRSGTLTDVQYRVLTGFLFSCFTGLRISDLYEVQAKWEVQDDFLDFIPHKNRKKGRQIRIPLLPIARSFIKDQGSKFFDLPNSVQFNETLKELARLASIRKRLTSHVARHSFGYLYMTTAGNLFGLKELLGHKKIESTERYSHLDDDYKYNSAKKIEAGFSEILRPAAKFVN